jgi:catechol 2,3-dioxygenase-like lactoylglutathione lyase family enzyme
MDFGGPVHTTGFEKPNRISQRAGRLLPLPPQRLASVQPVPAPLVVVVADSAHHLLQCGVARYDVPMATSDLVTLLAAYDSGTLSRRQLLGALAAFTTVSPPQAGSAMRGRLLHHVNVQVSDVARSETFYRTLLGLPPSRVVQGPDNHGLDLPGGGIIILQRSDTPGRIDHFCVGVESWDADRLRAATRAAGVERVQGAAADNFFVTDPDGLRVQVSAVDWSA